MSKIISKILVILLLAMIFISVSYKAVLGVIEITEAYITKIGEADYHLKYYKAEAGIYTYSTCDIVGHEENGKFYPAYCLNRDLAGVGKQGDYTVDISSILDNNQVWRAVKNGYPNKSGSELGLTSDYDAFVVTKFAIYCLIGQADINLYTADDSDEEGQAMLRALRNLVDIGLYGSESYSSSLNVTKDGDFVEDGSYYSQTYKVSSNAQNSGYTVTKIEGMPAGSLLTDVNGNIKTQFSSGEEFKIKIPKTELGSDLNINIELEANLKTYPIFYGKTRIQGTQDYLVTADTYENQTAKTSLNLKLNTGKVKITKIDQDTQIPIEGVEFELQDSNGKNLATILTDSQGIAEFTGLYQAQYIIKETKADENYIVSGNDFYVDVEYNKTSEIKIENEHKKGSLSIKKVDKDNNNIQLGNVEFDLYSEEFGKVVGTYYTNENGEINIENLRTGNYSLIEKTTNQWYNLAPNQDIEIKWNEITVSQIENELKKGQIRVIKIDKENNEVKIPNVEFEVLDSNMNVLEKITTNEEGEALTSSYALRDYDSLFLKEVKTDEKYVLNEEIVKIQLKENEITDITFENEKIKGTIKVIKTSEEDSKITGKKQNEPLEGVKFNVYNNKGEIVDTILTDSQGIATTKQLEKGIYNIKEEETNLWYILDENTYSIEIVENQKEETLYLTNTPENPDVNIEKTGTEKAEPGEEISYKINVENTGNVELDNFIWEDQIPTEFIEVTKFTTGTYNQEGTYSVYYKTNLNNEYILLLEDISCKENMQIDLLQELAENEYITNIKLDFKTVQKGFKSEIETELIAKTKSSLKSNQEIENAVTISANNKGYQVRDEAKWKTLIYKILPLTGM